MDSTKSKIIFQLRFPQVIAVLISLLLAVGCGGRKSTPQISEPITITKTVPIYVPKEGKIDTFYMEVPGDTVYGSDVPTVDNPCPEKVIYKPKRIIIRKSYNNEAKNAVQVIDSKVDSSVIQQGNKKTSAAGNGVQKNTGNTKQCKSKFWLGVLVAVGVFQGIKYGKKFLPPPFNIILGFIA